MRKIIGLALCMTSVCSALAFADAKPTKAPYISDLYKKSVSNILSNPMCDKQSFFFEKPWFHDGEEGDFQIYSTRYSDSLFVDFYMENANALLPEIEIVTFPPPTTPEKQIRSFCVISAIKKALEPKVDIISYMAIDAQLFTAALQTKDATYSTPKYDYSVSIKESTGMTFKIEPKE
ncbi:hypothetical protein [Serratia fonticola]|uniref:hypothetical protein n=1 Tax=Serratia fonticola TaxID=47917 RepID=UPI003AAB41CB